MTEAATGRAVVVADGRPLQRNLLRFLLEQEGYKVVSEAATGSAAAEMAGRYRPDVVVLQEALALESPDVVRLIRRASPTATVVILTADRTAMPSELTEAADASIEEGAGLRELAFVVSTGGDDPRGGWSPQSAPSPRATVRRAGSWIERAQGAVAAAIVVLAVVFVRHVDLPRSANPVRDVPEAPEAVDMAAAYQSLDALVTRLSTATPTEVVSLATALIGQRAILVASGIDVSRLDAQIAEMLTPVLPSLSPEAARALVEVLADLVAPPPSPLPLPPPTGPAEAPAPQPAPSPSQAPAPSTSAPTPSEEPSPTPSEEPSPTPSEEPSPIPTEEPSPEPSPIPTEEPSPIPTEEPSPIPTEEPSPTPSEEPSPEPSEEPSPTPSEEPSPTPSEEPSPTPSEEPSPTESPTATETPSPSSTEEPTAPPSGPPGGSPTGPPNGPIRPPHPGGHGAVLAGPSGLVILVASTGLARRLRRRR